MEWLASSQVASCSLDGYSCVRYLLAVTWSRGPQQAEPDFDSSDQRHDFRLKIHISRYMYCFVAHMHEIGYKNCRMRLSC